MKTTFKTCFMNMSKPLFTVGVWALIIISSLVQSCSPTTDSIDPTSTSSQEDLLKQKIQLTAQILRKIYADPAVRAEVNAAIKTGIYQDERVALKDLLNPETSMVYKSAKFKAIKSDAGARSGFLIDDGRFAKSFMEQAAILLGSQNGRTNGDYFTSDNLSIYFPYSVNFNPDGNNPITVVGATQDTDEVVVPGPGCGPQSGPGPFLPCEDVTVNDDYSDLNATHVVIPSPEQFTTGGNGGAASLNKVFVGWIRCRRQYDHLISFTGNGGGSELKTMRINGYLKTENQQITTYNDNLISAGEDGTISRKQIKNGDWIRVYSFFDTDWQEDDQEQALAIFEEDTQGDSKIEGSITTKLGSTEVKPISYSISVKTQDDIPVIFTMKRSFLFNNGKEDQHHGFYDNWPIYDGDGPVSYTIPFEIVPQ